MNIPEAVGTDDEFCQLILDVASQIPYEVMGMNKAFSQEFVRCYFEAWRRRGLPSFLKQYDTDSSKH